jgi:tetratricopeptide (TPR) repeat protein
MVFRPSFVASILALGAWGQAPEMAANRPDQMAPAMKAPTGELSLETRGDIQMARKMYREAIETYRKAPPSAVVENKIGIAYHQLMDLGNAKKQYDRASKLRPDYAEAINNLGTVYYAQKNYRKAAAQYRKALKLTPKSASIHSNLGTALFARKQYDEAFLEYQKALELDPEVFEHRSSHGVLLQERSVEERAKFHFYLAKTYAKAGSTERTLLYLRKAIEEGFRDRQKILEEPEFAFLKDNEEFQQILKMELKAL